MNYLMDRAPESIDYVFQCLSHAARTGQWLDMTDHVSDTDEDAGQSEDGVVRDRVQAAAIRNFLLSNAIETDPHGLQIRGVVIVGVLDLAHVRVPCRLAFVDCHFDETPIFEQAVLPNLSLTGSTMPGIVLDSIRVSGNIEATGIKVNGGVLLRNAQVGGQLSFTDGAISNSEDDAISLDGAQINGGLFMSQLAVRGEVRILGAHIGVQLLLSKSTLTNLNGHALSLDGTAVNGDLFMNGLIATGEVRAPGMKTIGQVSLEGAKLRNPGGRALHLDGGKVDGDLFMNEAKFDGQVRAVGATIGGQVVLANAKIDNGSANALSLSSISIEGDLAMQKLEVTGAVRIDGAKIASNLILTEAKLSNVDNVALSLDALDLKGIAMLMKLEAAGEVRALGARIGGNLSLTEARVANAKQHAICLDNVQISGSVSMKRIDVSGQLRALGAHIDGQLNLSNAEFTYPKGYAVSLDGAVIQGGLFMVETKADAQMRAVKAHIGGQMTLTRLKMSNMKRSGLNLSGATLGELILVDENTCLGGLDLSFATVRVLSIASPTSGLIPLANVQGWSLGSIQGALFDDRKAVADWLDTVDLPIKARNRGRFSAHPWKEMARIYDQTGRPEHARWLRYQAARRTTQISPWTSKLARLPYAGLVGYGYYPAFLFVWLAAMLGLVFALSTHNPSAFTPTLPSAMTTTISDAHGHPKKILTTGATPRPESYPAFSPLLYAVDTAIPATATGQSSAWRVTSNSWLPAVFSIIRGFSWVFTALLIAGITGILRKD